MKLFVRGEAVIVYNESQSSRNRKGQINALIMGDHLYLDYDDDSRYHDFSKINLEKALDALLNETPMEEDYFWTHC